MQATKRTISMLALMPALLLGASTSLLAQEAAAEIQQDAANADHDAEVEAATEAALSWLELVDSGEYGESWEAGAEVFKGAVTKGQWNATIGDARSQVGPLGERTLSSAEYTTELPNAPAGEYVILQFRTETSGDMAVSETVVPMKDDGTWKVSGYFVRP